MYVYVYNLNLIAHKTAYIQLFTVAVLKVKLGYTVAVPWESLHAAFANAYHI